MDGGGSNIAPALFKAHWFEVDTDKKVENLEPNEGFDDIRNKYKSEMGKGRLPVTDANGNPIDYTRYHVNPRPPGGPADDRRIVTGSDGSIYYTTDHYSTFTRVK